MQASTYANFNLEQTIDQLCRSFYSLEEEKITLANSLEAEKVNGNGLIVDQLRQQISDFTIEKSDLAKSLEAEKKNVDDATTLTSDSKLKYEAVQTNYSKLSLIVDQLRQQNATLASEKSDLANSLEAGKINVDDATTLASDLKQKYEAERDKNTEMSLVVDQLRQQISTFASKRQTPSIVIDEEPSTSENFGVKKSSILEKRASISKEDVVSAKLAKHENTSPRTPRKLTKSKPTPKPSIKKRSPKKSIIKDYAVEAIENHNL